MSSLLLLSLHACILRHVFAQSPSSHLLHTRQQELDRITRYELFDFDLSSFASDKIIRFSAFDQHFVIQLRLNEQVSPNINHQTRDKLMTHSSEPFQCHYHGRVLSPESATAAHQSVVALSMCDGRGVRGMVRALGETMYIYPANYYLNASSIARKRFGLHEQHLVYRWSDYNEADLGSEQVATHIHPPPSSSSMLNTEERRRRLIYNNGNNVVELYTLADEAFVNEFKNYYGNSDWFIELYHYISEAVSLASAEYEAGDWNKYTHVGTLSLKWVELDIVESLSGVYRSLAYSGSYSGKTGRSGYLRLFSDWSNNNKDTSSFDVGMAYSRISSVLGGGTAWVGGMCLDGYKYGVTASDGSMDRQRKMLAHEVGHNLGLSHDQSYGCPDGDIMGTGDYNTGWSDCSYQYLRDFFGKNTDRVVCLASRINPYSVNVDFPTVSPTLRPSSAPTKSPTPAPVVDPVTLSSDVTALNDVPSEVVAPPKVSATSTTTTTTVPIQTMATPAVTQGLVLEAMDTDDCVQVAAVRGLNGKWKASGMVNQRPAYEQNGLYVYMISDEDDDAPLNDYDNHGAAMYWVVSTSKGARVWSNGWCNVADIDIMGCSSQWYQGNGVRVKNSRFMSCSASDADIAPCVDSTRAAYGDNVCVHKGNDIGEDELMSFTLTIDEGCLNAYGIYEYEVPAPKTTQQTTGTIEIDDDEYFLHFSEFAEWVISAEDVSLYGAYICSEPNLFDCLEGKWSQWITDDDAEILVVANNMSIVQCSPPTDFALHIEAHSTIAVLHSQYTMPIIVSLLAIAVLTLCVCVCRQRCRNKRRVSRVSFDHIGQSEFDDVMQMPNICIETHTSTQITQ